MIRGDICAPLALGFEWLTLQGSPPVRPQRGIGAAAVKGFRTVAPNTFEMVTAIP